MVVLGFVLILRKPQDNDKLDSNNNPNIENEVSFTTNSSASPSSASVGSGNSLLNQLSMINARSFPALSKNQLPAKLNAFFGRKDVLLEVMGRSWDTGGPICLYGDRGNGKTALALELAHQLKPKYPDAQFYFDFNGGGDRPLSVNHAMGHVLRAFFPKESLPNDPAKLAQEYVSALKGKRVLMLVDNASKASQIKRLLVGKSVLILFTSREKVSLPGSYAKPVKELFPDEAELLLFFYAGHAKRWATEINELCGYSPMAIALAGSYLQSNPDLAVDTLVKELREEKRVLKSGGDEELDGNANKKEILDRNVEPIFNVIFRDMRKETATVLRKLALFSSSFDEKAVIAVCGDRDCDHLKRLVSLKFIEHDSVNNRYYFHELLHQLVKAEVRPSERILTYRTLAFYYFDILQNANELYENDEDALESALNIFDQDWFNIKAGQKWSSQKSEEDAKIAKLCGDYCKEARALIPMRHSTDECIEWSESALTASRESENVEAEKNNLLSLGIQLHSMAHYDKAIDYLEEAQTLSRKLGHVSDEKQALDLLGQCCFSVGNYERAIECFTKALEYVRLEGKANKEMEMLDSLAQACFKAKDYEHSEQYYKLALEKARNTSNKKFQAQLLSDLGILCNTVKKFQSAITYLKEAKTLASQGNLKVLEMGALENLSVCYLQTGKHKKALECLDSSLDLAKKMGDNRGQGIILKKMGDYYYNLKEFTKAIEYYERGLPKIRKFSTYAIEYSLLESLGNTYLEIDRFEKSQICFRHARSLGKKHIDRYLEAKALWNLSITCQQSGDFTDALGNAELASHICSAQPLNNDFKVLGEEIKEWMLKRVGDEIKDSGL